MNRRSLLHTLIAVAAITSTTSGWAADRGIQFTPSGDQVLANKDVGTDRWAITLHDADGTVTGNVFRGDGSLPAFVACNPLPQEHSFACFGADPCSEGGTQRGIQRTPDGKRVLVNKDVGADRWAIALNNDDQTVIGNVFQADGSPAFIVCTPLAGENDFACSGADGCTVEPCTDQFSFIDNVTLPGTFFEVPEPCTEQFTFIANVTLPDDFFRLTTTEDFISEVETGAGTQGMLRVGAAPIPGPNPPTPIGGVSGNTNVSPGGMSNVTVSLNGASSAAVTAISVGSYLIVAIADETCTPGSFVSGFYEIPLFGPSSQISLSLSFSENLTGDNFVLCITTISDGVIGEYFGFQQMSSSPSCGNGTVDGGEACDPPAAQSQCATGNLCSNDCTRCVAATSCAGRCCPGRDDNCTAEAAPCFCDEFCVQAQDCCGDALAQCGFGKLGPTISNLTQSLRDLNACEIDQGLLGSIFAAEFDFTDPDGDVTPMGSVINLRFRFSPSGVEDSGTTPIDVLSGDSSAGRLQLGQCYRFGNETSVSVTVSLGDSGGNISNELTVNTPKPQGAN